MMAESLAEGGQIHFTNTECRGLFPRTVYFCLCVPVAKAEEGCLDFSGLELLKTRRKQPVGGS